MDSSFRKVHESLFVSGYEGAKEKGDKFDKIVSLAAPTSSTDESFVITDGEHDYSKFESAVDAVINYLDGGNTVLVNCQAGISRSVSACISAQVCYYDLPFVQALQNARFGHRLPNPQLLESAERYISENYEYVEERRLKQESKKSVESLSQKLIEKVDQDDKIESSDRFKMHINNILSLELDRIQKK